MADSYDHIKANKLAEDFKNKIGKVIKKYRIGKKINAAIFDKELGISPSSLSRYENGKQCINAEQMAKISVLCDFELWRYTESYTPDDATESFMSIAQMVRTQAPKASRAKKSDNRPPKPVVVWDSDNEKWIMVERQVIDHATGKPNNYEDLDFNRVYDRMASDFSEDQTKMLMLTNSILLKNTDNGQKKCPQNLKRLANAVLNYVWSR